MRQLDVFDIFRALHDRILPRIFRQPAVIPVDGEGNHAICAVLLKEAHNERFVQRVAVVCVVDQGAVAKVSRNIADAGQYFGIIRVGKVRCEDQDDAALVLAEVSRGKVRFIMKFFNRFAYLLLCLRKHTALLIEHTGDGCNRNAGCARNVLDFYHLWYPLSGGRVLFRHASYTGTLVFIHVMDYMTVKPMRRLIRRGMIDSLCYSVTINWLI
ncbi:hypothetical protein SDC9_126758 [bioreactor metagenome]|uniref:Uncharacterized protein n=1 Tax=bioreactor metagenome TaxID=1076179 RepID=A0A645CS81_9ZZZZ